MIVCRHMKAHSASSRGPGLSRIVSGMAILPMSWSSAARASSSRRSGSMPREGGGAAGAELAPAEAVGGPVGAGRLVQPTAEPREEGVARGVAEGVVGELEAVEVEQDHGARVGGAESGEVALEVRHERPPV